MKHSVVINGVRITAEVVDKEAFNNFKEQVARRIFDYGEFHVFTLEQARKDVKKKVLDEETLGCPVVDIPFTLACQEIALEVVDQFVSGERQEDHEAYRQYQQLLEEEREFLAEFDNQ